MKDKIRTLFSSDKGKRLQEDIFRAINDYKMSEHFNRGVLVGLSGGADSVFLLSFLAIFSDFGRKFPVVAVHINHLIRGLEADRDEAFAKKFCESLGIEIITRRIDVPRLSKERKEGLEECARECRYSEFSSIIQGRKDISTICVAHNADDNLETVLLNLLRGCGTKGMAGIPPVRGNIVRPLIYISKERIVDSLMSASIEYVVDSTNLSNEYKRNFLRNDVLPKLREVTLSPEAMCARSSRNLRVDDDYISSVAADIMSSKKITNTMLDSLHEAVFVRVLSMMTDTPLASVNFSEIKHLLSNDNFSYSLPGHNVFVCERGNCSVKKCIEDKIPDYTRKLVLGVNRFEDLDADIILSDTKIQDSVTNVYKISIQANLSSAIIEGDLHVRPKNDGETIRYGGITRKVKKLFNDRKIPESLRYFVPLICDDRGAVFVPGFGVRDDAVSFGKSKNLFIAVCIGKGDNLKANRFHLGNEGYK